MKRLIFSAFLLIGISMFANKGNYDVAKYRQNVINYAMAQVGKAYSQANRMGANTYDCSSLIDRASQAAGMNSVTGANTRNWANTTASMRTGAKATKIATNQIKPGDAILFNGHVVYAISNANGCSVDVVHASNSKPYPKGGVKVSRGYNICKAHGGYLGVISAEQVLINNGYTPVNSSGQVITPPAGSSTNSSERKTSFDPNKGTKGKTEQTLEINFNKISNRIVEYIVDGAKEYFPDLKILLSILFAFELYFFFYEGFSGANEKFWTAFGRKILKFGFYLAVLENYLNILVFMYNFFLGIAQEFVGDAALLKIFELDNSADGINLIFSIMGEAIIVLLKTLNNWGIGLFEPLDSFYRLILILIILGCMLIVTIRYLFEIFIVKTQFFLAGGLASIFLPFEVFEKTKEIGGSRTLRAILGGGFLVTALAIVGTVSYDILKEYIVNEATTVDYLDLMRSFRFIMVCWIILKLMGSVREMLEKVMR
jgi:hypothetical protein